MTVTRPSSAATASAMAPVRSPECSRWPARGYVQSAKPTKGGVCKECIERTGVKALPNRNG